MTLPIIMAGGHPDDWGLIPGFLDTDDPRTAREQFDAHYGWSKFEGFRWNDDTGELIYGDGEGHEPPLKPISKIFFRDEIITLFPHAWVMVTQPDESWEIARMD